jgi:hypothetical protein
MSDSLKQLNPDNCGQTCYAILTGCSQFEAMIAVGKDHGTNGSMLRRALFYAGYEAAKFKFSKKRWPINEGLAILKCSVLPDYGHAVVVRNGEVLDPAVGKWVTVKEFERQLFVTSRYISQLIEVRGKRKL